MSFMDYLMLRSADILTVVLISGFIGFAYVIYKMEDSE